MENKFIGQIILAEEGKYFNMRDDAGRTMQFALLAWAEAEDSSYLIMQAMDGSMDENEALVFAKTEDGMELVTDMALVESIFLAYNTCVDTLEEE